MRRLAIVLFIPAAAAASPQVEIGLEVGGHAFSRSNELGTTADPSEPGVTSSGLLGARLAVPLFERLAIEGEAMVIPTKDNQMGDAATVLGLRAHVRFDVLVGRIRPFIVAGGGEQVLFTSSPGMTNDIDPELHWGLGVRWRRSDRLELRIDGRQMFVPSRNYGTTIEYEASAGITLRFGGKRPAPPPPPPPEEPPPAPVVAAPAPPPPPPPAPVEEKMAELVGISFERDSAVLAAGSPEILDRAVAILASHPKVSVEISGHTSSEGDPAHNLALSLARAETVRDYLVAHGIASDRLHPIGHGSEQPVADNTTEDGRAKNRRIEFKVLD